MNRYVVRDTVVFVMLCLGCVGGLVAGAVVLKSTPFGRLAVDLGIIPGLTAGLAGVGLLWRYRSAGSAAD